MKAALFEYVNEHLSSAREEYLRLMAAPDYVESVLQRGAERARAISTPVLAEIRDAVGIRRLA
jgi:tryptophanyl-tRNA synthetase